MSARRTLPRRFRRHRRRRLRRRRLRQGAGQARRGGHPARPATTTTSSSRCSTRWRRPSCPPTTSPARCGPSSARIRRSPSSSWTVTDVDPATRTVTTADGQTLHRRLPRAGGRLPAELLPHARAPTSTPSRCTRSSDAKALRTRLFEVFEEADTDPSRIDDGALNIVDRRRRADRRGDGRRARRPRQRRDAGRASTTST